MRRILVFLVLLIFLPACKNSFSKKPKTGVIVLLNGTSSSGKTSIIIALQKLYEGSRQTFETILLDDWLQKYDINSMTPDLLRDAMSDMFLQAKEFAAEGRIVFVDTVLYDDNYEHFCTILDGKNVAKILVYCSLELIMNRVKERNTRGDEGDARTVAQAISQFKDIYKIQENPEEVRIDYVETNVIKTVLQFVEQEIRTLSKEVDKDFEKNIQLFISSFTEQFKLDALEKIMLVPKHSWDLIVNTSRHSPEEIANSIVEYLKINRGFFEQK